MSSLIEIDASALAPALGRRPFAVRHSLDDSHPLLARAAVADRADHWPPGLVEHHEGDLPLVLPSGKTNRLPIGTGDVIRGIDDNGCWVILLSMEHDPAYRALLGDCLAPVGAEVSAREGEMTSQGMNLLIGSPHAVVPVHFDLHHNLLLQIVGTKNVTVGSFRESTIRLREVDRYFDEGVNSVRALPELVTSFDLQPGDGLYIPPYAMHWVQGGPETSIGVSCGFRTAVSERTRLAHQCNSSLRRRGLHPKPPGRSAGRDRVKVMALTQARRIRRTVGPVLDRARRVRASQRA